MKKYDWSEERKKALPSVEKTETVSGEAEAPAPETVPGENPSKPQSNFKEKFSKFALLFGRIAIFVCPAFSVANTLIQYFRPFPVQPSVVKPAPNVPAVRIGGTKMTLPLSKARELNMAFTALAHRKSNEMFQFSSLPRLQENDLNIVSGQELLKVLEQKGFRGSESTFTIAPGTFHISDAAGKSENMSLKGMFSEKITYKVYRASQYIAKIKVFASAALILTDANGHVRYIRCNVSREAQKLVDVKAQLMPKSLEKELQKQEAGTIAEKEDIIFDPALVLQKGKVCLAWKVILTMPGNKKVCLIVDQTNKKVVFRCDMKFSES